MRSQAKRGRTLYVRARNNKGLIDRLKEECVSCAGPYPSIAGMRKSFWGRECLIIKAGSFAYNMGPDTNYNN